MYPINYDTSTPGRPYIRTSVIHIEVPPPGGGFPKVMIEQRWATTTTEGDAVEIGVVDPIHATLTLDETAFTDLFPVINIDTGEATGQQANLAQTFALVASYVRHLQTLNNK